MAPEQVLASAEEEEEETAFYAAMSLASSTALPMAINAAMELNLFQLIKDAGPGASLSAADLASLLPASDPRHAADQIDRILRFLSAHSVVSSIVRPLPDGDVQRFYGLMPVCKYLTVSEGQNSLVPMAQFILSKEMSDTMYHVKDAVLEGGFAFDKAHGMSFFEYLGGKPKYNNLFNQAFKEMSSIAVKKIIEAYDGLEGVGSVVDVGGGTGAAIRAILEKHPNIKAINFDLPQVISTAPAYPGVEHVSGDMFVSVPKADAIFMKLILHDWGDEQCVKLLKNCYKSLPEKGKVVVVDPILMREPKEGELAMYERAVRLDAQMLLTSPGGKERSEEEFEALAKAAGFKRFVKVRYAYSHWIMEFHK